ncbi:outer membrane protein assembly factor BamC [Cellvibrio sp.]|uniref:outer membrane protein assembly factor BamC n=1 Tax=Cellvibrio sp. TaxID=1965322 RepID=UPI003964813B
MNLMTAKAKTVFSPSVLVRLGCLVCLSVSLSGCGIFFGDDGVFRNRENDYLKADSLPPLVLPEGVNKDALGELYPIPPISAADFGYDATASEYDVPRPMPLSANMLQDSVKIQRVGENSWILVNDAPGELWPRVRNFLNANNLKVTRADLKQGIIETGWLQFKTDLNSQDRYRLQIDQGIQPETSEIHITHMNVAGSTPPAQDPEWPSKSMNPEREKWLLDELSATLASDNTEGGTSMLAQGISSNASAKATLGMFKNEPVMTLKLDKTRTMATIAYAAKRDGFQLFESDASTGMFYVYYKDPEESKPGWFKRLFHISASKPKAATTPYSLDQITANMLKGEAFESAPYSIRDDEKNLKKAPGYLFVVTGKPGDYLVRVRDPYGKRLKPREARDLITKLRKNLI